MQTSTPVHFLLVSDLTDDCGIQVLREALTVFGPLQVALEGEVYSHLQKQFYGVVIVDAGAVTSAPKVVSQIHTLSPNTKIVVITASFHWKIARAVFRAGAADYLRKSIDREEILTNFKAILKTTDNERRN